MLLSLFLAILGSVASFFLWSYIHELSHVIAAKKTVGLEWYKMKLYPHRGKGGDWNWASVTYMPKREPTPKEQAIISLAPRVPGLIAVLLCPFFLLLPYGWLAGIWVLLWGGGVVDLLNGSFANSEQSDIRKAARELKMKVWKLRLLALTALPTLAAVGVRLGYELSKFFI